MHIELRRIIMKPLFHMLLAVCVSVVSVELISPDVPIIRIQSTKSRYGNARRQRIRELQTAHIAKLAFLEMFKLLAENFDDVLESVLSSVEETLSKDDSTEKLKRIEKEISSLEKKLTDMYLDDKISKEAYDDKYSELGNKLDKCEEEKR